MSRLTEKANRKITTFSELFLLLLVLLLVLVLDLASCGDLNCYSCTSYKQDRYTFEVRDHKWAKWLRGIPPLPRSPLCQTEYTELKTQSCSNGVCMLIAVDESRNHNHVIRTCVPNSIGSLKPNCSRLENINKGEMTICVCDTDLCNGALSVNFFHAPKLLLLLLTALTTSFVICSLYFIP